MSWSLLDSTLSQNNPLKKTQFCNFWDWNQTERHQILERVNEARQRSTIMIHLEWNESISCWEVVYLICLNAFNVSPPSRFCICLCNIIMPPFWFQVEQNSKLVKEKQNYFLFLHATNAVPSTSDSLKSLDDILITSFFGGWWRLEQGTGNISALNRIKCDIFGTDQGRFSHTFLRLSNDVSLLLRVGVPLLDLTLTLAVCSVTLISQQLQGGCPHFDLCHTWAQRCSCLYCCLSWLVVLIKRQRASVLQRPSSLIDHLNEVSVLRRVAGD